MMENNTLISKIVKPMRTDEIEMAIARHFDYHLNIIVPNVSWGLLPYEVDLIIVSPNDYVTEIEIKTSAYDLKRDVEKGHHHNSVKVKKVYFAIPEILEPYIQFIPEQFGILSCTDARIKTLRAPFINKQARKITEKERMHLLHLGCMRMWNLKVTLDNVQRKWRKKWEKHY